MQKITRPHVDRPPVHRPQALASGMPAVPR